MTYTMAEMKELVQSTINQLCRLKFSDAPVELAKSVVASVLRRDNAVFLNGPYAYDSPWEHVVGTYRLHADRLYTYSPRKFVDAVAKRRRFSMRRMVRGIDRHFLEHVKNRPLPAGHKWRVAYLIGGFMRETVFILPLKPNHITVFVDLTMAFVQRTDEQMDEYRKEHEKASKKKLEEASK